MKKMTAGIATVILLAGCGATQDTSETTTTATEDAANQQAVDATNGNSDTAQEESAEQEDSPEQAAQDEQAAATAANGEIREFDLELKFTDDREWEFDYDRNQASIERGSGDRLSGQEAQDEFAQLFQAIQFSTARPLDDFKREVLEAVNAQQAEVRDFELDVKFDSGEEMEIDHDVRNGATSEELDEFSLELTFTGGGEASYEFESDEREAEIERRDGSESEGAGALDEMEQLIGQVNITTARSIDDMKAEVLQALSIDTADVDDFDLEVDYRGGEEIKFFHGRN
ncbi:YusW family protein [Planococcus sp. CP5-4]|uniref:YusW family protein n=1 Tax=unclassified Planococcus (in: firmicutes) TaxID=2662419 RepID=UPI001C23C999|nr:MULTISPECIES: YusW family protein [unclassified Planococcus (in: firmicutes)]MBU9674566.1 YusW family protein [Planococcus sp. CP5-4_YE]MBV0910306.1 YusW family protein [Planococcus sp. CP5-4_UN]MBW6065157.1 YusW family protein [Planococcus sp. CP5-4]